ncbi:hypothetical protein SDC9_148305 [bioreactor metagenome]|uniref:Uncharacterized protein n=2 Tax=root TaxID=1 RepID=A0A645EIK8_9ZZZZ
MLIAANSQREKTAWDKLEEVRRTRNILERAKKQEKIPGGTRDLVAKALHTSPAQIGRYDAIIKNLSPTFTEELKQDHINISTAYELSGLTQEEQSVAFAEYKESGTISIKDARAKKPDPVQAETKPVQKEPLRPTTQHKIQSEREKLAAPVIEDFGTMQTSLIEENSDQPQLELAPEQNEPPKESTGCSYAKMYAEMIGEAINAIEFMINEAKKNHEVTISISDVEPLEAALAILKNFNSGRSRR